MVALGREWIGARGAPSSGPRKMHSMTHKTDWGVVVGRATGILVLVAGILLAAGLCTASQRSDNPVPNIFDPRSTPAESIRDHSYFVLAITSLIFLVVFFFNDTATTKIYTLSLHDALPISSRRRRRTESGRSRSGRARRRAWPSGDRKSTRLNSSHSSISYAVFCLKKKKNDVIVCCTWCIKAKLGHE